MNDWAKIVFGIIAAIFGIYVAGIFWKAVSGEKLLPAEKKILLNLSEGITNVIKNTETVEPKKFPYRVYTDEGKIKFEKLPPGKEEKDG